MPYKYAFEEFRRLISDLQDPISDRDPVVRYLCALVSELAYHHVPEFEIDHKKRAKIIPCKKHIEIVNAGIPTDVIQYIQGMDFMDSFVVVDRGVVAVGINANGFLFIGFRGTVFLFDWKINLQASLIDRSMLQFFDPIHAPDRGLGRRSGPSRVCRGSSPHSREDKGQD